MSPYTVNCVSLAPKNVWIFGKPEPLFFKEYCLWFAEKNLFDAGPQKILDTLWKDKRHDWLKWLWTRRFINLDEGLRKDDLKLTYDVNERRFIVKTSDDEWVFTITSQGIYRCEGVESTLFKTDVDKRIVDL